MCLPQEIYPSFISPTPPELTAPALSLRPTLTHAVTTLFLASVSRRSG
jgi:hypothetical protein